MKWVTLPLVVALAATWRPCRCHGSGAP